MPWMGSLLCKGSGGEAQYKRVVRVTRLHMKVGEARRCWNGAFWLASSLDAAQALLQSQLPATRVCTVLHQSSKTSSSFPYDESIVKV